MPGDMMNTDWSTVVFGLVVLGAGVWCFLMGVTRD